MNGLLGNRIAELAATGIEDRRNGAYRGQLLAGLGAIEPSVPRSRTMSGVAVIMRYARQDQAVDRVIVTCFVLGLSTRKVGRKRQAHRWACLLTGAVKPRPGVLREPACSER